jgi:hypothetical protein
MTFQPGAVINTQGFGSRPENVEVPHIDTRAPTASDVGYPIGKDWVDTVANVAYKLTSQSSVGGKLVSSRAQTVTVAGALATLTTDDTNIVVPVAGNINIAGAANQFNTTGAGSTVTINLDNAVTFPGSATTTTTLASGTTLTAGSSLAVTTTAVIGTGLTVTTGGITVSAGTTTLAALTQVGTAHINVTGAGVTTIGTGGTGAVNIGNATGNTAVTGSLSTTTTLSATTTVTAGTGITSTTGNITATAGNVAAGAAVTATTTVTAGTGITSTTGNIVATAGAVNAGTSMTATLGNITATNGNLSLGTAGNKIVIATGANASVGTSGVMSGTPGAVTVATTASSATAKIFFSRATTGGTPGNVSITAQDGTGFTLTSTGNETSTFNWWIINA